MVTVGKTGPDDFSADMRTSVILVAFTCAADVYVSKPRTHKPIDVTAYTSERFDRSSGTWAHFPTAKTSAVLAYECTLTGSSPNVARWGIVNQIPEVWRRGRAARGVGLNPNKLAWSEQYAKAEGETERWFEDHHNDPRGHRRRVRFI